MAVPADPPANGTTFEAFEITVLLVIVLITNSLPVAEEADGNVTVTVPAKFIIMYVSVLNTVYVLDVLVIMFLATTGL